MLAMRMLALLIIVALAAACTDQGQVAPEPAVEQVQEQPQAEVAVMEGRVWFAGGDVALPDGAVATVSLLDTSLQDVAATLLGEQTLSVTALPFDFRIEYDPSLIEERNEYSLQALVELDGDLLYINDTVHTVLTYGSPAQSDIEVIQITPPKAGETFTTITVRAVPADGVVIPLGSEVTARMVNSHRPLEVIDELSIPVLAFPIELNLLYDPYGLDSTYTYQISVTISDGDRVLFGSLEPARFDPSAPPAEPLLVRLAQGGSD